MTLLGYIYTISALWTKRIIPKDKQHIKSNLKGVRFPNVCGFYLGFEYLGPQHRILSKKYQYSSFLKSRCAPFSKTTSTHTLVLVSYMMSLLRGTILLRWSQSINCLSSWIKILLRSDVRKSLMGSDPTLKTRLQFWLILILFK